MSITDSNAAETPQAGWPAEDPAPGSGWNGSPTRPYERRDDEPLTRPLKIYTLDPAVSRFVGAQATVQIPYEPLSPGPMGCLFEVVPRDSYGNHFTRVDLDEPSVLLQGGLAPSATDHRFHQQMVYAVATVTYQAFRKALGRPLDWGFQRDGGDVPEGAGTDAGSADRCPVRLQLFPCWREEANAYYDRHSGSIRFGYYCANATPHGRNLPGGYVFTCLSHDVIAHEVSHALLDGQRPRFTEPTNPDVLAFHEAFSDLVALFQHFSYPDVVAASIQRSGENITAAELLTGLARQFGHTIEGKDGPLRTAVDVPDDDGDAAATYASGWISVDEKKLPKAVYPDAAGLLENAAAKRVDGPDPFEPHNLGSVLVSAVFEAFTIIFQRKSRDYVLLATGGRGILPKGNLPETLQRLLAKAASDLAKQFLTICIRAIDYCPPVDITFGDYLRSLITADHDLVPGDPWGYREALIDAFRRRRIYPTDVPTLAEESLLWRAPRKTLGPLRKVEFTDGFFRPGGSPPLEKDELRRRAQALWKFVTHPCNLHEFGLSMPNEPQLAGDEVEPPRIGSIRSLNRVGPDGQLLCDVIAEVVQRRWIRLENGSRHAFWGGTTLIIAADGQVRYSISKNVLSKKRRDAQVAFLATERGKGLWKEEGGEFQAQPDVFCLLHKNNSSEEGASGP